MKMLIEMLTQYIQGNKSVIEAGKLLTIGLFALTSLAISIYFLFFSPYVGFRFVYVFIPHLYLIPIILLALWYPKSGVKLVIVIFVMLILFWIFSNVLGYYTYTPLFVILYTGIDLAGIMVFLLYVKDRRLVEAVILDFINRNEELEDKSKIIIDKNGMDFDSLISALHSPEENIREEAVISLAGLSDDRIVFPLISTLKDKSPHIRRLTCEALGSTKSPKVVKPLIDALTDEDRSVRETASEELGHLGNISMAELIKRIEDQDWRIRMGVVVSLRVSNIITDHDPIIRALADKSVYVRREAVKTLGRIGDKKILPYLVEATNDPDPGVRLRALHSIAKVGSSEDISPIFQRCMCDSDSAVRIRASEELQQYRKNSIDIHKKKV